MVNTQSEQRKVLAVISGDIHYSLANLSLADKSTRMAIAKANDLNVPFIANGDTHDSKANLRGECVNALIETFKTAKIKPYVNIGNHCKIHAKSLEHSLNFLRPYAHVIDTPQFIKDLDLYIIPYHDDTNEIRTYLKEVSKGSTLIMHQGIEGANLGDYAQDKSAVNHEDVANYRVIASHYHQRQSIITGHPRKGCVGLFDYIGSPFTQSYGEANDPPKGFQILMSDGTLEFVPTNLRKHVVIDIGGSTPYVRPEISKDDLVWVKVRAPRETLLHWGRATVAEELKLTSSFRLDLIPIDTKSQVFAPKNLTQGPLLDSIIDSLTNTSDERKTRLKQSWKDLV